MLWLWLWFVCFEERELVEIEVVKLDEEVVSLRLEGRWIRGAIFFEWFGLGWACMYLFFLGLLVCLLFCAGLV